MIMEYETRDESIRQWRREGITQIEIARRLNITRQRVQQIERRLALGARRIPGVYKTYSFRCKQCRREVSVKLDGRSYCSRDCFFLSRNKKRSAAEEKRRTDARRERNRVRSRAYYHGVFKKRPDWKKIVRERNQKYARLRKNHT